MWSWLKSDRAKLCLFWLVLAALCFVWALIQFDFDNYCFFDSDFSQYAHNMLARKNADKLLLVGPASSYFIPVVSPLYYWIIYPFYLLTGGAYFYIHLACFVYTWVIFLALAAVLYKRPAYRWSYLLMIALFCFMPVIMVSATKMWSPNFVWQAMVVTWYGLILAPKSKRRVVLSVVSGTACAAGVSLEPLIIPVAIGFLIIGAIRLRKNVWPYLISFGVLLLVFWVPTFITEFGQIIARLLAPRDYFFDPFVTRLHELLTLPFADFSSYNNYNLIIVYVLILVPIFWCFKKFWRKKLLQEAWFQMFLVVLFSSIVTLIPKINMTFWYTTGFATVLILLLITLPVRIKYLTGVVLVVAWMRLALVHASFVPRVTATEIEACVTQACQKMTSNDFHYAVYTDVIAKDAVLYLLFKEGCLPTTNWENITEDYLEMLTARRHYQLLVFHDLDTLQNENDRWPTEWTPPFYVELKPSLDALYTEPIASASCDGDWGWTLYEGKSEDEGEQDRELR